MVLVSCVSELGSPLVRFDIEGKRIGADGNTLTSQAGSTMLVFILVWLLGPEFQDDGLHFGTYLV